jgi:mRNA interferase HigB
VVVIAKTILQEFGKSHADAIDSLNDWWAKSRKADWATLQDIKNTFNSVDYVGNDGSSGKPGD